jgi:hypothetical protein
MTQGGETIAAWRVYVGGQYKIQTSVRPAGGSFSAPTDVIPFGNIVENLDLSTDPAGNAILTWRTGFGGDVVKLFYSYRPAGGVFSPAQEVVGAGEHVAQPTTVIDAAGNATTLFLRAPGDDFHLAYVYRPAGGDFGEQQQITPYKVASPRLKLAADGTAIAAWKTEPAEVLQSARRPPGGNFGLIETVTLEDSRSLELAVSPGGRAVIATHRDNGVNNIVEAAIAEPGDEFGPPVPLSTSGVDSEYPLAAIDPAGAALVAWRDDDGGAGSILSAASPPGGPFAASPPPPGSAGYPGEALFAGDGGLAMTWVGPSNPTEAFAAIRSPAGAFGAPALVSQAGENVALSTLSGDERGNYLVLYSRHDAGPNSTLRVTGYDGVPPAFLSLTTPPKPRTGVAAEFSADVFDVFGATVEWKFGDGRSATGAAVEHTFRATGGTRTITVTATDPAGQSTTESRTIKVKDVTPVVISKVRVKPRAFAARGGKGAGAAKVNKGSSLRFRLSERARVRIAFERARRVGKRLRYIRLRSAKPLQRKGRRGGNRVRLTGRAGAGAMAPGKYRAVLVATDTGGLKSKTRYARFRIVGG